MNGANEAAFTFKYLIRVDKVSLKGPGVLILDFSAHESGRYRLLFLEKRLHNIGIRLREEG
jgi:hypothetical protein